MEQMNFLFSGLALKEQFLKTVLFYHPHVVQPSTDLFVVLKL